MSLGEMTTYKPLNGGFIRQALDYTDEALAFAQGIGYWYNVRSAPFNVQRLKR